MGFKIPFVCVYVCTCGYVDMRLSSASTLARILLMFELKQFVHYRPMPGECGHSSFQNGGPSNGRQNRQLFSRNELYDLDQI
jgi:hypothetical protein